MCLGLGLLGDVLDDILDCVGDGVRALLVHEVT